MKCSNCNKVKSEDCFPWRVIGVKRNTKCRECHAVYVKNHYLKNKQRYIERAMRCKDKDRKNNKLKLREYLSDKCCLKCGNNDSRVLDFDHLNPDKKRGDISVLMKNNNWNIISKEIKKCQILCANCHRIKTFEQFGWKK